ncbi:indole-3-glycerol phosphate synthase [Salinirussus salinus]|jgi:indole-3-glycerol phosphate synthase|uniref:indole-3-glycerol phosphate synthase n=1 Tax=Salinirussus salinus TaxID=1198300 RepID=UPI0013573E3A|nr:indole-3-glycerol phosphate synthase [Salinirussus salinus]
MGHDEELAPAVQSILATARERGGGERVSVDARSFPAALERAEREGRVPLVAEVKPTSPTTDGEHDLDPVETAEAMVEGGATALSVLTEPEHFGGTPEDLRRVREAVDVPVLRKDFLLREEQLDTVAADLVLLIARFLDDLEGMVAAARDRGFQPLVEVHTETEAERALAAGAQVVGVNNRDLARLEVDLGTFERVAPAVEGSATLIAESGIGTVEDVRRMRAAGADALLVGSALMAGHPRKTVHEFTTAERQ